MAIPPPNSFLDVVATTLAAIAILFAIAAVKVGQAAVRTFAILLVVAIGLYANNAATYFAIVFIVATAITELGFLEKLVAILRGNKDYFDYQKQLLSVQEAKDSAAKEVLQVQENVASPTEPEGHRGDAANVGYMIEQLALSYVEKRRGLPVERNVRYEGRGVSVEFDGVIQRTGGRSDVVIEVKLIPSSQFHQYIISSAKTFLTRERQFEEITGRRATALLVAVVKEKRDVQDKESSLLREVRELSHTIQLEIVDFDDIGFRPQSLPRN